MAVENEYKFTSTCGIDRKRMMKDISSLLIDNNLEHSLTIKEHKDLYYDSEDLEITSGRCFLRVRDYGGKYKITVKRPVEENGNLLSREEIERESDGSFSELVAFSREFFPDVEISERPVLELRALRSTFKYSNSGKKKLTFDECTFVDRDRTRTFWELELECMGDEVVKDFDDIGLNGFLSDKGMVPVYDSKYERGLRWKGTRG